MQIFDIGKDLAIMINITLQFDHQTCTIVKIKNIVVPIIRQSFLVLTEEILRHLSRALERPLSGKLQPDLIHETKET